MTPTGQLPNGLQVVVVTTMPGQWPQVPRALVKAWPTPVAEGHEGHDVREKPGGLGRVQVELTLVACDAHKRELGVRRSKFPQLPDGCWNPGLAASEVLWVLEEGHDPESTPLARLAGRDGPDREMDEGVARVGGLLHPFELQVRDPPGMILVANWIRSGLT